MWISLFHSFTSKFSYSLIFSYHSLSSFITCQFPIYFALVFPITYFHLPSIIPFVPHSHFILFLNQSYLLTHVVLFSLSLTYFSALTLSLLPHSSHTHLILFPSLFFPLLPRLFPASFSSSSRHRFVPPCKEGFAPLPPPPTPTCSLISSSRPASVITVMSYGFGFTWCSGRPVYVSRAINPETS